MDLKTLNKLMLIAALVAIALPSVAEYDGPQIAPRYHELCFYCATRIKHHRHAHHHYHHHKHRPYSDLSVYYPLPPTPTCSCGDLWTFNYCACCPSSAKVPSTWGDYVIFSSQPVSSYDDQTTTHDNPDLSTADDLTPDMEVD